MPDTTEHPLLADLNEGQRDAVLATGSPVLILAGAGSGKTRAITRKIAWMIQEEGLKPWEILAVTFTNKAAEEMRSRVSSLLGSDGARGVHVATFHSTCLSILRDHASLLGYRPGFGIYDTSDQKALVNRILRDRNLSERAISSKRVRDYIDRAKNEGQGPGHPDLERDGHLDALAAELYADYQNRLLAANAMDFGDLLVLVLRLFDECPAILDAHRWRWRYVLVDEFQDTNRVQYAFLRRLCGESGQICVVGDDDQSIYRWRGARVQNILGFPEDFPGAQLVYLDRNYRSSGNILSAATHVIANNTGRYPKSLETDRPAGEPIRVHVASDERAEARWIVQRIANLAAGGSLGEIAIFYRTSSLSRVLEDALRTAQLPYRVFGGLRFYERAEIKDLLAYLKILINPSDVVSLTRAINTPPRGIGPTTLDKVLARATAESITPIEAAQRLAEDGTTAVRNRLGPFCEMIAELGEIATQNDALTTAQRVLELSGYWEWLRGQDSVEADARLENLHELLVSIEEFQEAAAANQSVGLQAFLDQVALVSDIDKMEDTRSSVSLMTIHAAKGLEFDSVFVCGMEEDILPHFNASHSAHDIEEERRLCYVAMTRARHNLHVTRARFRRRFGGMVENLPSRFLDEFPCEGVVVEDPVGERLKNLRSQGMAGQAGARFDAEDERMDEPSLEEEIDGVIIDRSYDQSVPDEDPGPGTRVRHRSFGLGTIHTIDGMGPDARVRVEFDAEGQKTIVARFLIIA